MAINQEKWLTHFFSAAATPFFLNIFWTICQKTVDLFVNVV
jgi:hypothetical protein